MSNVIELTAFRPASPDNPKPPCPHLQTLKGCMRHEGRPLKLGQIDLFGCLAQTYREQGVEFYVPNTDFFRPLASGQPERRQG